MRFSVEEVEVGPFLVDLTTGRMLRDGIELGLRPQAFRVFKTLIQNRGQYVDHEHMIDEAWDGTVVSHHAVDATLAELKKALQESVHGFCIVPNSDTASIFQSRMNSSPVPLLDRFYCLVDKFAL